MTETPGSDGERRLQREQGTFRKASTFYNKQMLDHLNPSMCEFISRQEMAFIATSDSKGECDCSFRAGEPGFALVLNKKTLIYPEYRGNGVLASLGNIMENPHIGIIFIDFTQDSIGLHVNGKARIIENEQIHKEKDLADFLKNNISSTGEANPERWVFVEVEEAYIHCSKHIPLFKNLDKKTHWGTEDKAAKGGDYFKAKDCDRPWKKKK